MNRIFRLKLPYVKNLFCIVCISFFITQCTHRPTEKPFKLFGNVYRIDSVAGQEGFADPFYIVLTRDSLFSAFGYWDYSYPYETKLRITDSLQVFDGKDGKYEIQPLEKGFWLNFPRGKRSLYTVANGKYDSAYKHLRIMKTQESLLLGKWKFVNDKSESRDRSIGKDLLRCQLDDSSTLRFTRLNEHKIVQVENVVDNKIDTCLRRDFRLDGNAILIFDYDGFPPWTILKLDNENLIIQGPGDVLYFEKVMEDISRSE